MSERTPITEAQRSRMHAILLLAEKDVVRLQKALIELTGKRRMSEVPVDDRDAVLDQLQERFFSK